MYRKQPLYLALLLCSSFITQAQVLTLKDAVDKGIANYESIKAKDNYARASQALVTEAKKEALPNLVLSAQQDYGTINGQNGPAYGLGGFGVASSGAAFSTQNWNAAFGGLYLANINWDFFTFGRVKERINTAASIAARDIADREQEIFQQKVKIAAAYLNLIAAQRITRSQQNNLNRADTFKLVVTTRAKNGLIAGVDSSLANAEVSNAKLALIRAKDAEQERANQLAVLMGIPPQDFILDTLFITQIPAALADTAAAPSIHPLLQYYQSRISTSRQQAKYLNTFKYPTFSLFGIIQTRGSGFASNYLVDQSDYTHGYWDGIKPVRTNYLLGVGVTWNITSLTRVHEQVKAQDFITKGLTNEYNLIDQQIKAQQALAVTKISNAISSYLEAPVQIKAASDAYLQKTVLYKNGLSNIVDVTQTLYTLNRAETDRDVAYSNVWQALLLKAAAAGNFSVFINEIR